MDKSKINKLDKTSEIRFWGLNLLTIRGVVIIITFVVYIIFALHWSILAPIIGDEPHYLIVTQSIVQDHDLALENEQLNQGTFYYDIKNQLHVSKNSQNGHKYSAHGIGLPLLMVPGYLVAGSRGAWLTLIILATLLSYNIFLFAYELSKKISNALIIWLAISFSIPIFIYSSQFFTETVAALFILYAFRKIYTFESWKNNKYSWVYYLLIAFSVAILPWLHAKNIVATLVLLAFFIYQVIRNKRINIIFYLSTSLIVLIIISFFLFLKKYYGSFSLNAQLGLTSGFDLRHMYKTLIGLFFDQEFGLFFYSPFYILAIAGFVVLVIKNRSLAIWLAVVFASIWIVNSSTNLLSAGWCPPNRFLVPILPLLLIPLVYGFQYLKTNYRVCFLVLLSASLSFAAIMRSNPALAYNDSDRKSNLLDQIFMFKTITISRFLPSFVEDLSYRIILKDILWILIILLFNLYFIKNQFDKSK